MPSSADLGGLECLSGIPGSAGATPVQNVGAYGVEVADCMTRVQLLDRRTGEVRWVPAAELGFGYRHSVAEELADGHATVLEVEFALDPDGRSAPLRYAELAAALGVAVGRAARSGAGARDACWRCARPRAWCSTPPTTTPGASVRSSPIRWCPAEHSSDLQSGATGPVPHYPATGGVKLAAGWLVEKAGFGKGFPATGPCRLSTKHALALTNRGGATTADVLALARTVRDGVHAAFGVTLVPEPVSGGLRALGRGGIG